MSLRGRRAIGETAGGESELSVVGTDSKVKVLCVDLEMSSGVVLGSNVGKARDAVPVGRVPRGVDLRGYTTDQWLHART